MPSYKLSRILKSPIPLGLLPYVILLFGFLGFIDAGYLTVLHYKNAIPPCTLSGCETVLSSSYATFIPGIPTSLIGVGFYGATMVLTGLFVQNSSSRFARTISMLLFALCSLGLLVGILLIGIQAFVLHAYCQYCLLSELVDFLLFDGAWWLYSETNKQISQ